LPQGQNEKMNNRFGVIDIGSLKVKFQVAERKSAGELVTLHQSSVLTQLGSELGHNGGRPKPEHLRATIAELARCQKLMAEIGVDRLRAVSTHALREMGPAGREIARQIKKATGLTVEIISQKAEAELFFKAVLADFVTDDDFAIMDQGGGSVQILIGNRKELKHTFLLKTGSSFMWDKFTHGQQGTDFPNPAQVRAMTAYVLEQLQPIPEKLKIPIIYGSSNVIDVFRCLPLPLEKYTGSPTHPVKVGIRPMEKFLARVWPMPYEDRDAKYHYPQKYYMWGIDKAFLNAVELARKLEAPYVIPSNANINQGLLQSMIS
jgi:exopolyphosphatase/pppGpp-phosphohydrolase